MSEEEISTEEHEDVEPLNREPCHDCGDNEPAFQALIKRALAIIRVTVRDEDTETTLKRLPKEEQSHSGTEVGVMPVVGFFRTLKLLLGSRIQGFIRVGYAVIPRFLLHTCFVLNVRSRGPDGIAPWERVRGRPFNQLIAGLGKVEICKLPVKGPESQPDGNMGARQSECIFVRHDRFSNTFTVICEEGKDEARSMTRRPVPNRWSAAIGGHQDHAVVFAR